MIRRLIGLIVFGLFAYAGWHVGLSWFHYQRFQDGVREAALFGRDKTDDVLRAQVMNLAQQNDVPLDDDFITIQRQTDKVRISATYAELVAVLPGYKKRFDYTVTTP